MPRNLVICFDGTWNTPDEDGDIGGNKNTNVHRLYQAVAPHGDDGREQKPWYDEGVGNKWYNKLQGGAFGVGLSRNIQQGYQRLVEEYEDGDEVYIFGFSRGAYTARSLVGLIRNAGLLTRANEGKVKDAYELYRTRDEGPDSSNARWFRDKYSRMIKIRCLAVWDTVGALGVPIESFEWFNKSRYAFHDTELSSIVENAFHAIAIDEHREHYAAALWDPKTKPNQRIEQVWFAGAHCDIGGGYEDDSTLASLPLAWIARRAVECGLALKMDQLPTPPAQIRSKMIHDSFATFLGGVYRRMAKRSYRAIGYTAHGQEVLDASVRELRRTDADYRPSNAVGKHAGNTDPEAGRIVA